MMRWNRGRINNNNRITREAKKNRQGLSLNEVKIIIYLNFLGFRNQFWCVFSFKFLYSRKWPIYLSI